MIAFCIGLRTTTDTLCLTIFICAGIARLARFNATVALVPQDAAGKSKYIEGLPIPTSLFLVGIMAECARRGNIVGAGGSVPGGLISLLAKNGIEVHWASLGFLTWAAMMLSKTMKVPKL